MEKGRLHKNCPKLMFKFTTNLRQFCANLSLMHETKYRQFCAILATNLRNAPFANAALSAIGISDLKIRNQKNPRAHKNKIGTSPPPPKPPPPNAEFYGHGFSCRKNAFFQVSIKLAQPFPAPELRTRILRTRKSMGNKVPWKTGVLIYLHVTSRPLISLQKEAVLSPCNFATTHLTACILNFYLP